MKVDIADALSIVPKACRVLNQRFKGMNFRFRENRRSQQGPSADVGTNVIDYVGRVIPQQLQYSTNRYDPI